MPVYILLTLLAARNTGVQPAVNVQTLGANPNGTNAAATTAAFQTAFTNYPTGQITVPAGTYAIDNSAGWLTVNNFSGSLVFEGGATLMFTSNEMGGLLFIGGSGATITGLTANYSTVPTYRNSPNEMIKFSGTTNTTVTNITVYNSPAAGILFYDSVNPKVTNATVIDSWADGLNFSNCQNAQVTNLTTENTGDDGLSFLNYEQYPNLTGGLAQNISITNSQARGIAVVGQSNVTVNGFQVKGTASSGVLVAQDTYYNTRIPANVLIENGTISGAGTVLPLGGNQYGIEYNSQTSATFTNITVTGSLGPGMSGAAPSGSVTASGITVESPGPGSPGFLFYQTKTVHLTNLTANGTPSYGFMFYESGQIIASGLTAINTAQSDPLQRAIWFEDSTSISATTLDIVSASGDAYIIGCYTDTGYSQPTGSVKTISSTIAGGTLSLQNSCSRVTFTQ
jgi:parallel beta-helix repeat protein